MPKSVFWCLYSGGAMTDYRGTAVQSLRRKMNKDTDATYLRLEDIQVDPACQARARWLEIGCPDGALPDEHWTFTEKLVPFRDAARKAAEDQRQRFLELSRAA
jgi:hypothetical protein